MPSGSADIVIKNGRIFTSRYDFVASFAIDNGRITALGSDARMPNADLVIDASDKIVIPGGIDAHVHVGQPWNDSSRPVYYAEDIDHASMAAAMAGITTICDMPDSMPLVTNSMAFKQKVDYWKTNGAYVDYAFHGGFIPGSDFRALIPDLWKCGVTALKTFMCFSEDIWPAIQDGELLEALKVIHEVNGFAILHAENDDMLTYNKKKLDSASRCDYRSHLDWRPPIVEHEADRRATFMLGQAGASGLIVHTSLPEGVAEIQMAKAKGQEIFVETTPHYLYLTDNDVVRRGPWAKCSPPLRNKERVAEMRTLLAQGLVDTVGSDHSPFAKEDVEKVAGENNMWKAEAGIPGLETGLPLLINGCADGWLSIYKLVGCASENIARIYGLHRKGRIEPGYDGDVVIIDMKREWVIRNQDLKMKCGWSPFDGMRLTGMPITTISHGTVVMKDRQIVGPKSGRFVPRSN